MEEVGVDEVCGIENGSNIINTRTNDIAIRLKNISRNRGRIIPSLGVCNDPNFLKVLLTSNLCGVQKTCHDGNIKVRFYTSVQEEISRAKRNITVHLRVLLIHHPRAVSRSLVCSLKNLGVCGLTPCVNVCGVNLGELYDLISTPITRSQVLDSLSINLNLESVTHFLRVLVNHRGKFIFFHESGAENLKRKRNTPYPSVLRVHVEHICRTFVDRKGISRFIVVRTFRSIDRNIFINIAEGFNLTHKYGERIVEIQRVNDSLYDNLVYKNGQKLVH